MSPDKILLPNWCSEQLKFDFLFNVCRDLRTFDLSYVTSSFLCTAIIFLFIQQLFSSVQFGPIQVNNLF